MRRRLRSARAATLAVIALGAAATIVPTSTPEAGAATPARFVTGWIPNWSSSVVTDGVRALGSGQGVENIFVEASPFGFSAVGAGTIATSGTEANLTTAVNALHARGLWVVPSITDGTGKGVMAAILADPTLRTQHVQAIVALVLARNYEGIDLDYEGFAFTDGRSTWASTRPNWAAFVNELAAALHAHSRMLSITVPPIWAGGAQGYQVYAWPEIIGQIDRLRVMVYDWSVSSAGPISPMTWLNDVLAYTASVPGMQMGKVQVGVPTYGRSWASVVSGTCPGGTDLATRAVQMEHAGPLAAAKGATPARDTSGEMRFTYNETFTGTASVALPAPTYTPPVVRANQIATADAGGLAPALRLTPNATIVTCTVRRTVYYPDADTVVMHAQAALAAGTAGIAIWALGYESPDLWPRLMAL